MNYFSNMGNTQDEIFLPEKIESESNLVLSTSLCDIQDRGACSMTS